MLSITRRKPFANCHDSVEIQHRDWWRKCTSTLFYSIEIRIICIRANICVTLQNINKGHPIARSQERGMECSSKVHIQVCTPRMSLSRYMSYPVVTDHVMKMFHYIISLLLCRSNIGIISIQYGELQTKISVEYILYYCRNCMAYVKSNLHTQLTNIIQQCNSSWRMIYSVEAATWK